MTRAVTPPRIPHDVPKPKRRPNLRRNSHHLAFIRGLPCIACGRAPPSQAAHVRVGTDGYAAGKPSDRFSLPLCGGVEGCHAKQHRIGELTFWSALRVDPLDAASRLWTVSGDAEAGQRIVFRANQTINLRKGYNR